MFFVVGYPKISPIQRILLQHINLGTELNFKIPCKVRVFGVVVGGGGGGGGG